MDSQFKRILNLARRTGDRIIAFESNDPENAFVVMPFDDYEDMIMDTEEYDFDDNPDLDRDLTDNEMIDKINRDIAVWKNYDEDENISVNEEEKGENSPKKSKRSMWKIPEDRLESAEEVVEDQDRQYLEEITY